MCDCSGDCVENEFIVSELRKLLHDERYSDSKDWRASGLVGRVEWLIAMYENEKAENDMVWGMLDRAQAHLDDE
jgi:hypothetical protein